MKDLQLFLEALLFICFGHTDDKTVYTYAYKDFIITLIYRGDLYRVKCHDRTTHVTIEYNDLTSVSEVKLYICDWLLDKDSTLLENVIHDIPLYHQEQLLIKWSEANGYNVKDGNTLTAYINYINSKEVR